MRRTPHSRGISESSCEQYVRIDCAALDVADITWSKIHRYWNYWMDETYQRMESLLSHGAPAQKYFDHPKLFWRL